VLEEIKELHAKGQPVLVGTISVEKSEAIRAAQAPKGAPRGFERQNHAQEPTSWPRRAAWAR
jgi:preprotein translocase subunit SecA